jgi:hypothetical protein
MKKLFTTDNYLTGFLVSAASFTLYYLITTNTWNWKYIIGIPVMVIGFSAIGYIINKAIQKFSK